MGSACCKCRCNKKSKKSSTLANKSMRYGNLPETELYYEECLPPEDNIANDTNNAEADDDHNNSEENGGEQRTKFFRLVALFSYNKLFADDLEFKRYDVLLTTSTSLDGWIEAIHPETGEIGFVPGNYVRFDDGKPENLESFQDIDRLTAEKKLFLPGQATGTYIIRKRGDKKGYAISVLVYDKITSMNQVHHYQIMSHSNRGGYYVERGVTFPSVKLLLDYYSVEGRAPDMYLKCPCPRIFKPPVKFREFEVDRKSIVLGRNLGKGEFGEVYEAKWNNQLSVAVKQRFSTTDVNTFIAEAKTMYQLHHPRIVQLLGVCTQPPDQPILIILELLPRGSLLEHLRTADDEEVTMREQVLWMTQISDGMRYLEERRYIHRDLRAANVLVDRDFSVKVADFGLARILEDSINYTAQTQFPIRWTAPEAATGRHIFSIKSDVWSFGIVMHEILTRGEIPYHGITNRELMPKLLSGYRMPNPLPASNPASRPLYELMLRCWDANPQIRPSFNLIHQTFCTWELL